MSANTTVLVVCAFAMMLASTTGRSNEVSITTTPGTEVNPRAHDDIDFSGKAIEWIIPFKEGGGSDAWARFNAPFLSRHLPGAPAVIVKNMPGGGSTKAANRYAANAPPNGLSLLGTSASTQFPYLLGDSRVRYDFKKWTVLMVYPTGGVIYISPDLGIGQASELARLKGRRLTYGSQGATSGDLVPLLGFELLGLNVRPIFGIRGGGAKRLAFERGDANIDFQTSAAYINDVAPLVRAGKAIPLFTLGVLNEGGKLTRDPTFPDLPHFAEVFEMLHGKPPGGPEWESWFAFFSAGFGAQKLLVVPKATPAAVVTAYRAAITQMLAAPDYQRARNDALGAYEQVTGDTAVRLYRLATNMPEASRKWIRDWLREKYNLNLR